MNYVALVAAITDATENTETSFVNHIPDFVRDAEYRIYSTVPVLATRKNSTGSATAAFQYVAVPSDWLATYSFAIIDTTGNHYFMVEKDENFIYEAYPNPTTTGRPLHYAYYDQSTFLLGPTPDTSYSLKLSYYGYPTSIVTAGSTWLGNNFEHALLYGSLVYAYTYMKGEKELLDRYEALYADAMNQLKTLADGKNRKDAFRDGQARVAVK